jgi:hypothetical protein
MSSKKSKSQGKVVDVTEYQGQGGKTVEDCLDFVQESSGYLYH